MPEMQEVFRMATQKVRPDPGFVDRQYENQRRQSRRRKAGALALGRSGATGVAWLFSSSQAVAHLTELLPAQDWRSARAVATHPRIAQAARSAGFGVVCESRPSLDAVAAALESFR